MRKDLAIMTRGIFINVLIFIGKTMFFGLMLVVILYTVLPLMAQEICILSLIPTFQQLVRISDHLIQTFDQFLSQKDDIAVDWVANNVYWVDAVWSRIEVADLNGTYRAQLIPVGANSNPRAIAVEPQTRY